MVRRYEKKIPSPKLSEISMHDITRIVIFGYVWIRWVADIFKMLYTVLQNIIANIRLRQSYGHLRTLI
jgi:hypothetical protein